MYYELLKEMFVNGTQQYDLGDHYKSLVIKLYAPRQGFGKTGFTQAGFNHELVWVARPCEIHGKKLSDMERRGCGAEPPAHMKERLKKKR